MQRKKKGRCILLAKYDRYGAPRPKRKRNGLVTPLSFVLVCLAIVFAVGVFFRVQDIQVKGAEIYSDEVIVQASGISEGDNLFFINRFTAASHIFEELPFVESATVDRSLPNRIVIRVDESYALAFVDWEGQNWMMTANCKMLASGTQEEIAPLIRVTNISVVSPSAGTMMTVGEGEGLKLTYLQSLLQNMESLGMQGDVTEINMQNAANPTFEYQNRFTVKMGPNENTDYKLRMLLSAVAQMDEYMMGTIDLSEGTTVHVTPE